MKALVEYLKSKYPMQSEDIEGYLKRFIYTEDYKKSDSEFCLNEKFLNKFWKTYPDIYFEGCSFVLNKRLFWIEKLTRLKLKKLTLGLMWNEAHKIREELTNNTLMHHLINKNILDLEWFYNEFNRAPLVNGTGASIEPLISHILDCIYRLETISEVQCIDIIFKNGWTIAHSRQAKLKIPLQ